MRVRIQGGSMKRRLTRMQDQRINSARGLLGQKRPLLRCGSNVARSIVRLNVRFVSASEQDPASPSAEQKVSERTYIQAVQHAFFQHPTLTGDRDAPTD